MKRRESRYRMLLALYPPEFRAEHADGMVGTLLEGAGQRGWFGEGREIAGLLTGAVRARGELASCASRNRWRHGLSGLVMPLAVLQLAILGAALWNAQHPFPLGGSLEGAGGWGLASLLIAAGLLVAASLGLRDTALILAVAGLLLFGYKEWHEVSGHGVYDDFSLTSSVGFLGPLMLPYLLFSGSVLLVAVVAWSPESSIRGGVRRATYLLLAAFVIAALFPMSLYGLLTLTIVAIPVCVVLGLLDRRIYGFGLGLWLVALPYAFWAWCSTLLSFELEESAAYGFVLFLILLPLLGLSAFLARRRLGRIA